MKLLAVLSATVAALAMTAPAAAAPVTFVYSGNFSGTIAGQAFSAPGTFTGISDTDDFILNGPGFVAPFSSFSGVLGGTIYNVTTPAAALFLALGGDVFGVAAVFNVLDTGFDNAFGGTFELVDPDTTFPVGLADSFFEAAFDTDLGAVAITDGSDLKFTLAIDAGAVPEPATWAMMIVGLGLTGAMLRIRGRKLAMVKV